MPESNEKHDRHSWNKVIIVASVLLTLAVVEIILQVTTLLHQ